MVVSAWGMGRIRVETDYLRFFSASSPVRIDNTRIGQALAGTQLLSILVDGKQPESATRLPAIEGLRELQRFIDKQAGVDKTISLLDYIAMLRETLAPGTSEQPFDDQRMVDDLVLLLNPEDTRKTVSLDYSRSNITVYTRLSGSAEVRELVDRIESFGKRAFPDDYRVHATGTVVLLNRSAVALATSQITGLRNVFVVLFILMLLLLGNLRLGLLSLVPNVLPAIVLFGIMGWFGIDLNISTSLIAVVAVGIAVDDTIHYLTTFRQEMRRTHNREAAIVNTVRTVGRPILVTSVALSAGFLVVCLSNFQPIRQFGILSSVTMAVALLADLFLLPPLLITLRIGDDRKEKLA
jgi:predicted RND superfamily exporter protein